MGTVETIPFGGVENWDTNWSIERNDTVFVPERVASEEENVETVEVFS